MAGAGSRDGGRDGLMEAVRALAGALAARGTNEATALKQEICYLRLGPGV